MTHSFTQHTEERGNEELRAYTNLFCSTSLLVTISCGSDATLPHLNMLSRALSVYVHVITTFRQLIRDALLQLQREEEQHNNMMKLAIQKAFSPWRMLI